MAKNKIYKGMTKTAIAAVLASSLVAPSITQAADHDLYDKNGTKHSLDDILLNPSLFDAFLLDIGSYKYELGGKTYNAESVNNLYNAGATQATIAQKVEENGLQAEEIPSQELVVESVMAINGTTVKVTFNKAVDALTKADVTVVNAATSEKAYVKEVKLAADKLSAEVVLYDALTTKTTYKVTAAGVEGQFEYVVGDIAKIEATATQTVKASASVDLTKLKYTVTDENGLDITATTKVTFESDKALDPTGTAINLSTAGDTAFVYVVATKADGTTVKSSRITVKSEAATLAKITNYSVATAKPTFTATDYKQNLNVQMGVSGYKLFVEGIDQFGEDAAASIATATYESLDTDVAIVNKTDGAITPLKEGTLPVRITVGDFKQTIELQVVAQGKASTVEVDKATLSISNKVTTAETVKVTVKDQYGTKISPISATATLISGKDLVTLDSSALNTGTLKVTPVAKKSGTAVIEVKVSETVKASITVTVTEAGVVDNYTVEGFKANLDKNSAATNENKVMTLSVFPVDANGVKTGDAVTASAKMTIEDADGKFYNADGTAATSGAEKVAVAPIDVVTNAANYKTDKTYTVKVYVGLLEVYTASFTVADTSELPVIKVKENKIAVNAGSKATVLDAIGANLDVTYGGTKLTYNASSSLANEYKISKITYVSNDTTVVDSDTDATAIQTASKDGKVDLLVQSVEITIYVDGGSGDIVRTVPLNETFVLDVDITAPTAGTPTIAVYNPSTGILTITTAGLDVADKVDVTKISFTSSGTPFGSSSNTFALTNSTAEITDATTITVTLSAEDKAELEKESVLTNIGVTTSNGLVKDVAGNVSVDGSATIDASNTTVVGE